MTSKLSEQPTNGAARPDVGVQFPPSREDWQAMGKAIEELRAENKWLMRQLALAIFPPETSPPFDPADYHPTTWDELEAALRSEVQELQNAEK